MSTRIVTFDWGAFVIALLTAVGLVQAGLHWTASVPLAAVAGSFWSVARRAP